MQTQTLSIQINDRLMVALQAVREIRAISIDSTPVLTGLTLAETNVLKAMELAQLATTEDEILAKVILPKDEPVAVTQEEYIEEMGEDDEEDEASAVIVADKRDDFCPSPENVAAVEAAMAEGMDLEEATALGATIVVPEGFEGTAEIYV